MKILFIGYGNMAQALIQGLRHVGVQIYATAPRLATEITADGVRLSANNSEQARDADLIFLAVKPHLIQKVAQDISPVVGQSTPIISLAAGITMQDLIRYFPINQPLIRAMPNTPMAVGAGVIALFANTAVDERIKLELEGVLANTGITTWVDDENLIAVFTALTGSGPAYVLLFIEALSQHAIALGLNSDSAEKICTHVVKGAVALLENSLASAQELRAKITSSGGTTNAGIQALQAHGFTEAVRHALLAAYSKTRDLGQH